MPQLVYTFPRVEFRANERPAFVEGFKGGEVLSATKLNTYQDAVNRLLRGVRPPAQTFGRPSGGVLTFWEAKESVDEEAEEVVLQRVTNRDGEIETAEVTEKKIKGQAIRKGERCHPVTLLDGKAFVPEAGWRRGDSTYTPYQIIAGTDQDAETDEWDFLDDASDFAEKGFKIDILTRLFWYSTGNQLLQFKRLVEYDRSGNIVSVGPEVSSVVFTATTC